MHSFLRVICLLSVGIIILRFFHIFACISSHLLLLLSCILLYGCITITLISSWWTIELCPVFWVLQVTLLCTFLHRSLYGHLLSFSSSFYNSCQFSTVSDYCFTCSVFLHIFCDFSGKFFPTPSMLSPLEIPFLLYNCNLTPTTISSRVMGTFI